MIKQYDVFELAMDLNPSILKGSLGTILEIYDNENFEVEFLDGGGSNIEYKGQLQLISIK